MKITNEQLLMSVPTINKLMQIEFRDGLTSFRMVKNARALSSALDTYQEFAKGQIAIDDDVLKEEIEVDIKKISPSQLKDLTPVDMGNILFMLEDEDELPETKPDGAPEDIAQGVPNLPPVHTEELHDAEQNS